MAVFVNSVCLLHTHADTTPPWTGMRPYSDPFLAEANGEMVQTLVCGRTIHPYFWTTGVFIGKNRSPKDKQSAYPSYNGR